MSHDNKKRYRLYRQLSWYRKQANVCEADFLILAGELFPDLGEVTSTSDIATDALEDLLFALKGWFAVQAVRNSNGTLITEARVIMSRINETADEAAERQTADGSWD